MSEVTDVLHMVRSCIPDIDGTLGRTVAAIWWDAFSARLLTQIEWLESQQTARAAQTPIHMEETSESSEPRTDARVAPDRAAGPFDLPDAQRAWIQRVRNLESGLHALFDRVERMDRALVGAKSEPEPCEHRWILVTHNRDYRLPVLGGAQLGVIQGCEVCGVLRVKWEPLSDLTQWSVLGEVAVRPDDVGRVRRPG